MFIFLTIIAISGTEGYVVTQIDRDEVLVHNIWNASRDQQIQFARFNSEPFEHAASIIRTYRSTHVSLYCPSAIPGEESIRAAFIVLREIENIAKYEWREVNIINELARKYPGKHLQTEFPFEEKQQDPRLRLAVVSDSSNRK